MSWHHERHPRNGPVTRSRRDVLGTFAASLAAAMPAGPAPAASDPEVFRRLPKSVWVWNTEVDELPALGEFAHRWKIGRVLLGLRTATIDRLVSGDLNARGAIERLRDSGIEVVALTGDPGWVEHEDVPRAVARIVELASRTKLFHGLDLDVEPHTLRGWHAGGEQQRRLMLGHIALFEALGQRTNGLPLGGALHPTYAKMTLPDGRNYLEALCRTLQSASLMAYRNRPPATVGWSAASAAIFERVKTPWRSGVLVHDSKEANISYVGRDQAGFIADMADLDRRMQGLSSSGHYRGLIFEDYKGLRAILRI